MSKQHFKPVNAQIRFPEVENEVLTFWKEQKTFYKSLDATKGKEEYIFYDGPPFATGLPHYGHLLAGTLKDIIPRYWTMRGYYVERRFGWDCHGLPIENEVEKEFNVSGKQVIEKLGIHLFNEACRSIVLRYTRQWQDVVERMGRWVDFNNQYHTMNASYMESIWWAFKQVWEKDLIYEGFRVQPYCPRCATPLSNFELNQGYRDTKGPSITVTFPLADEPKTKILVWTTTPWTLPSNVLLVVGEDITYVKVEDRGDHFILAKDRLPVYYKKESEYKIIEEIPGSALVGKSYQPLFEYFTTRSDKFFKVYSADFVSTEDGTGIVHIAPAFGEDDFQVGLKLELPIVCPVDSEGCFTEEVPDWQGKVVYNADEDITRTIKKMGRLIHRTTIVHRYPFCYRCDTALIYKAIDTWFMKIEPLKTNILENNQRILWVPEHLKDGRFGKGVESAPDWNISRNRYWGTPLPVWICPDCEMKVCIGSLDELHDLFGNGDRSAGMKKHADAVTKVKKTIEKDAADRFKQFGVDEQWADKVSHTEVFNTDIHIHIVDSIDVTCPKCGSKSMKRTPEVLDCWFESGSMPYAQSHYPFENREVFERNFPADFIAEGIDQTRGWFYTLMVLGSALFKKETFKNVIVNGIILAEDGKKLSKRLKNYTPPEEILDKLGADALRLFLINSPAVKAEDLCFSEKGVTDMARSVLLPFWNAYSFFVTYANVDGWKPEGKDSLSKSSNELDVWIVSLLDHLIASVNKEMEQYRLYKVVPLLVEFIGDLTNWYIRRSRRRFWKSENDADKKNAYATLHFVLVEFSKVMAPFLPFLTEAVYRNLVVSIDKKAPESVHLTPFPQSNKSMINYELEERMGLIRQVVVMGRMLRSRYSIKNRQPLSELTVVIRDDQKRDLLREMELLIKEELNVKKVVYDRNEDSLVEIYAKPNFRNLGKVYGSQMKEAKKKIEELTQQDIRAMEKGETRDILGTSVAFGDIEVRRTKHEGIEVETQGELTIALNTDITEELKNEGHAREFVNRIQNMRKNLDLNVTDRIKIACSCDETLKKALSEHRDFICNETLSLEITWNVSDVKDHAQKVEINGFPAEIAISKASV